MKVRLTLTEEMLGTASSDPEIHDRFIASKAPDALTREEEVTALGIDEVTERSMTVFSRDEEGYPVLWDYQVKGFFKDACGMLARAKGTKSSTLTAYKKIIDGLVFVFPRHIQIQLPEGGRIGECQRPLRAQTAQGERVALANSETVPIGSIIEFEIKYWETKGKKPSKGVKVGKDIGKEDEILENATKDGDAMAKETKRSAKVKNPSLGELIEEWLDYGEYRGLGQWRNSGKGRFSWEPV